VSRFLIDVYICTYVHIVGITPKITTHPRNEAVAIASDTESISLTCEAVGGTLYYWGRQDGNIPIGTTGVNTNTLTIVNVKPEDSGNYRCVVSNDSGENFSDYAAITVCG